LPLQVKFKPQYDPSRVPIFTQDTGSGGAGADGQYAADDMLAMSIAAAGNGNGNGTDNGSDAGGARAPPPPPPPPVDSLGPTAQYASALSSSVTIVCEMIAASASAADLARNEVAAEVRAVRHPSHTAPAFVGS